MSSTGIAPPRPFSGGGGVSPEVVRQGDFIDKLLQIRDEVFASKHLRIRLSPAVLEQVARRPTQQPTPRAHTNGIPNGNQHLQPISSLAVNTPQSYQAPAENNAPADASRPFSAPKPTSSGIDPVLLTKSDNLIRAELKLKRQQIERSLMGQLDKRNRTHGALAEDRFDMGEVLEQAHEVVKPVSGLHLLPNSSDATESFDENSYYSSKANSWSSDDVDPDRAAHGANPANPVISQPNRAAIEAPLTANKLAPRPEPSRQQTGPAVIDLEEEAYEPADDIEIYEPEPARLREEQEESDYSPPPADVGASDQNTRRRRDRGIDAHGATNGLPKRPSPGGKPPAFLSPKKRRREEKKEGKKREKERKQPRQKANKRAGPSPEPYIKEEPQSPPPFASYPDAQPHKRRALEPLPNDVEVLSNHDGRLQPVYHREQDHSPRSLRPYEEPNSPTVIRVPQRRLERDDHDLRRVASLQYARRPYSPAPADPFNAPEPRQIRAASHAFVDRPEPVYREVSARPSAVPRYARERSRSPPIHEYVSRGQSPAVMAPPSRRVVEDQFGNKYYQVEYREPITSLSRRLEPEPFYERAVTREPTMRGPTRTELYEGDAVQRMPPPPRRYIETSDSEAVEARPFRPREASHRPMEVDYAAREVMERRPVIQYEDMAPPREYVPSRAYSVRPEVVRRDEFAPVRHESVQPRYVSVAAPRYREVSLVAQEPYDERRFAFAAQGRRYGDEGASERPVELGQDAYGGEPRQVRYRY